MISMQFVWRVGGLKKVFGGWGGGGFLLLIVDCWEEMIRGGTNEFEECA